jgi:hypothetical protein
MRITETTIQSNAPAGIRVFVLLTLLTILLSWVTKGRGQAPPSSQAPQAGQPSGPTPVAAARTAADEGTADHKPTTVTANNLIPEADLYFEKYVEQGNLGKFVHVRQPASIDMQGLAQMDPGTIYFYRCLRSGSVAGHHYPAR